jgi:hypothetical protein
MARRNEFGRLNRCRNTTSLLIFLIIFLIGSAGAEKAAKPTLPKYDLQTEVKIKGTIDEVKLPPKGSEKEIVHLAVKSGADTLDIYLCPKSFMDDMGMDFSKGDEISLSGSKIKEGDADLILTREVVKGNNTFALRDPKGEPVWSWHH